MDTVGTVSYTPPVWLVTLFQNFETTFPLMRRILGDACTAHLVLRLVEKKIAANPLFTWENASSQMLAEVITDFPDFLTAQESVHHVPYVGDLAHLELSIAKAQKTPYVEALSPNDCLFSDQESLDVCFVLHPSVSLFASHFPVHEIWQVSQDIHAPVQLGVKSSWGVVICPGARAEIHWLSYEEYVFVESLFEGYTLGQTAEKLQSFTPNFSFQKPLALAFSKGFFVKAYSRIAS